MKVPCRRMKAFFSNFKTFLFFFHENSQLSCKSFREKKTFDTHSTANLPTEHILNSKSRFFFQKTPNASSKKNQKNFAGLSKLLSTCPVELFDENNFLSFCEKFYNFLNNLARLSKMFGLSAKILSAELSKLHSKCPDEYFRVFKTIFPSMNEIGRNIV